MDKKKILLVGAHESHDWIAKALGEMAHYDVERIDIMDGLEGRNPHVSFFVELSKPLLINLDFSKLENHFAGMYDMVSKDGVAIWDTHSGRTYTGRDIFWDPELQRLPRKQTKEDYFCQLFGAPPFPTRGMGKSMLNAKAWEAWTKRSHQKPADHPSRKREPKGPRGKWGKL